MFERTITRIVKKIEDDYKTHLDAVQYENNDLPLPPPNAVVVDAFDSDKYRQNIVVYVQPTDFEMSYLSNHSEIIRNRVTVIIAFRGRSSSDLIKQAMRYLEAFRNMVRQDPRLGTAADDSRITDAHIYASVEGSPSMTACEITLLVESEEG